MFSSNFIKKIASTLVVSLVISPIFFVKSKTATAQDTQAEPKTKPDALANQMRKKFTSILSSGSQSANVVTGFFNTLSVKIYCGITSIFSNTCDPLQGTESVTTDKTVQTNTEIQKTANTIINRNENRSPAIQVTTTQTSEDRYVSNQTPTIIQNTYTGVSSEYLEGRLDLLKQDILASVPASSPRFSSSDGITREISSRQIDNIYDDMRDDKKDIALDIAALSTRVDTLVIPNLANGPLGYVLQSNGSTYQWVATSTLGIVGGGGGISDLSTFSTSDLAEGTNLYFTNARARSALSSSATGLSYNSSTGDFSLTSGYVIPTTTTMTNLNTFYTTPSNRITAGTNLAWSGNTLNVNLNTLSPVAVGNGNTASGIYASAFGYYNTASGDQSSAFGSNITNSTSNSVEIGASDTEKLQISSNGINFVTGGSGTFTVNGTPIGGESIDLNNLGTVQLGNGNIASGPQASAFGYQNTASGLQSTASGYQNTASGNFSIAFGRNNIADSTVSGYVGAQFGSVALGHGNNATASGYTGSAASAVGVNNTASGDQSSAFGYSNNASGSRASALGYGNTASGAYSSAFGNQNTASEYQSSAFGSNITNTIGLSVMIGPSDSAKVTILSSGGIGIRGVIDPDMAGAAILDSSGALLTTGGTWTNASSIDLKENFVEVDKEEILSKISQLEISQWNYKTEDSSITHIGPIAEQFYELFGLGGSGKSISTIDPAGIALVGLQVISEKINWLTEYITYTTEGLIGRFRELTTNKLILDGDICVDGVCLTKEQFKAMIEREGGVIRQSPQSQDDSSGDTSPSTNSDTDSTGSPQPSEDSIEIIPSTDTSSEEATEEPSQPEIAPNPSSEPEPVSESESVPESSSENSTPDSE